jgi:outer membrane protein OmpA-like peptidoglycan-associated protein
MMTTVEHKFRLRALTAALVVAAALAGCATTPQSPAGAEAVRNKLSGLQRNTDLATRAPVAIKNAEEAVVLAELPESKDRELGAHRVYMADQSVEIAIAKAKTRFAEDQRAGLSEARGKARLDARTREADQARGAAELARGDAEIAQAEADVARDQAEQARLAAEADRAQADAAASQAALDAAELQRQIDALKAEATERGLVLTLGDLLFAFDSAELKSGGTITLDRLVTFLNQYPERRVAIEGHTDNVGSAEYNRELSQRRADSVSRYLQSKGISGDRLAAKGLGKEAPLVSNDSDSGRQQNRRVELIIDNPPVPTVASPAT